MIEVILAMTLLAMVTGMIYAAFHLGVRAVEKGQVAAVNGQRARAASDIMRRQIRSAFVFLCSDDEDDTEGRAFFEIHTNPPSLEFVTAAGLNGGGGLEYVKYEVRTDPTRLVMRVGPLARVFTSKMCGSVDLDATIEAVLIDGFVAMEFEKIGYADDIGDTPPKWSEEDNFGAMPRGVGVSISGLAGASTDGGQIGWRFPIIAQLSDMDAGEATRERVYGGGGVPGIDPGEDDDEGGGNGGEGSNAATDSSDDESAGDDPEVDE